MVRCTFAVNNKCSRQHPGYVHAESLEEVERAFSAQAEGRLLYERTGVQIVGIERDSTYFYRLKCFYKTDRDQEYFTLEERATGYILIPDFEPVTNDELAEVYKILGVQERMTLDDLEQEASIHEAQTQERPKSVIHDGHGPLRCHQDCPGYASMMAEMHDQMRRDN